MKKIFESIELSLNALRAVDTRDLEDARQIESWINEVKITLVKQAIKTILSMPLDSDDFDEELDELWEELNKLFI